MFLYSIKRKKKSFFHETTTRTLYTIFLRALTHSENVCMRKGTKDIFSQMQIAAMFLFERNQFTCTKRRWLKWLVWYYTRTHCIIHRHVYYTTTYIYHSNSQLYKTNREYAAGCAAILLGKVVTIANLHTYRT